MVLAALVIGATGGIGRGLVDVLVAEGYALTVTGRRQVDVDRIVAELAQQNACAAGVTYDAQDPGAAAAVLKAHLENWDRLDLLVVSAGASRHELLADSDPAGARRLVETNLSSVLDLLGAAIVPLREAGKATGRAHVVLLSSVVARQPLAGYGAYSATKAAVNSLARTVNEEEGQYGVRATAICPGFVNTAMTAGLGSSLEQPMLPVEDIGEALRFLLRLSSCASVPELEISRVGVPRGRP